MASAASGSRGPCGPQRPLRHSGHTHAPTPTGDYAPSLRSPWRAAVERLWRTVKYEDVYLRCYSTLMELEAGLAEYFAFYNDERPHQALAYRRPTEVYLSGTGGGARVLA
jgi:hypothetical protein